MALAWGITRKRVVAYRVAGAGSLIVGAGFIVWAFLNFGSNGLALFAGYLGFVMISVGRQIPAQAGLRDRLQRGTARDAMQPIGAMIAADSTLLDATERWLRPYPKQLFPVHEGGRIVGAISLEEAADYPASRSVGEAMIPFDDPPMIEDTEPLDDVVDWIGARDGLVTDITGHTVGMISVQDIDRWLREHWSTDQYVESAHRRHPAPPRPVAAAVPCPVIQGGRSVSATHELDPDEDHQHVRNQHRTGECQRVPHHPWVLPLQLPAMAGVSEVCEPISPLSTPEGCDAEHNHDEGVESDA